VKATSPRLLYKGELDTCTKKQVKGATRLVGLTVRYADRAWAVLLTEQNTLVHLKDFKRKYEDERVGTEDIRLGYLKYDILFVLRLTNYTRYFTTTLM